MRYYSNASGWMMEEEVSELGLLRQLLAGYESFRISNKIIFYNSLTADLPFEGSPPTVAKTRTIPQVRQLFEPQCFTQQRCLAWSKLEHYYQREDAMSGLADLEARPIRIPNLSLRSHSGAGILAVVDSRCVLDASTA